MDPKDSEHKAYMKAFNKQFYTKVKRQIDVHTKKMKVNDFLTSHGISAEVIHHSRFCMEKCANFSGRDEMLLVIQQKLGEVYDAETAQEECKGRVVPKGMKKTKDAARDGRDNIVGDWHNNKNNKRQYVIQHSKRVITTIEEEDGGGAVLEKIHKTRELNMDEVDTDDDQSEGKMRTVEKNGSSDDSNSDSDEDDDDSGDGEGALYGCDDGQDDDNGGHDVDEDASGEEVQIAFKDKENNWKSSSSKISREDRKDMQEEDGGSNSRSSSLSSSASSLSSSSSASSSSANAALPYDSSDKKVIKKRQKHRKSTRVIMNVEDEEVNMDNMKQMALEMSVIDKYTKPLIVYGVSGSGKTALLAKVAQQAAGWFRGDLVKVVRFLGTSPGTSTIRDTLVGICLQISEVYKIHVRISEYELRKDFTYLCAYFAAILHQIDTDKRPLLIVLDSLDQLSPDDYVFSMEWLDVCLPPGVMMLLSLLPDHHGALNKAKKMLSRNRFIEVTPLPKETASTMMTAWLQAVNRQLTEKQLKALLNSYTVCPQPLWLKIAFEEAKTWR